jgi:cysteinyl-tRNA synthetase
MADTILDLIGNTPMVEIGRLNPNDRVRILAKLEYFNPGGSIKDRAALSMIESGERSGGLTADKTVIEATSGNTGIGLALVCSVKGYRLLLAMSEAVSTERQKILKARGAEILLTPGHLGTDGAIEEVYRLVRENPDEYFMTDQFNNEANWKAHYHGTAVEIWEQTNGAVSVFVATLGTSGTLMGASRKLKEYDPAIRVVGVEPYLGHKIQGLKNMKEAYCPEIFDKRLLDSKVNIDDEEAFEMTRRLAREEGLLVGMSSGAAMAVALKEAAAMDSGTLVVVLPDGGERYLSTPLFVVKEKIDLQLYHPLSRTKVPFEPLLPGKVSVFTPGPTAHAGIQVADIRRFVFSDLLCRYLTHRGYSVRHVMNITDLDDKTIEGSEAAGMDLAAYTEEHIAAFMQDLELLGIRPADSYPRASEYVDDMVALAEKLVSKGYAYEKLRSLYFDISRFPSYGQLSGIDVDKVRVGVTVDLDEYEKDNPRDFTLFKRTRLSELKRGIYTKTAWGNVRPSWHIQAAAMSLKTLGECCDIHLSSRELIFPHHENIHAIATAVSGKPPARNWIDCERILVDGRKIAASQSPMTLQDLTALGYTGKQIRFWLLSTHYRKPLSLSPERLDDARRSMERVNRCLRNLSRVRGGQPFAELNQLLYDIRQGFIQAMDDDLNVSAAMASLFRNIRQVNSLMQQGRIDPPGAAQALDAFRSLDEVLNVMDFEEPPLDERIERILQQRDKARAEKNWQLSDRLREELISKGVPVHDDKAGD